MDILITQRAFLNLVVSPYLRSFSFGKSGVGSGHLNVKKKTPSGDSDTNLRFIALEEGNLGPARDLMVLE